MRGRFAFPAARGVNCGETELPRRKNDVGTLGSRQGDSFPAWSSSGIITDVVGITRILDYRRGRLFYPPCSDDPANAITQKTTRLSCGLTATSYPEAFVAPTHYDQRWEITPPSLWKRMLGSLWPQLDDRSLSEADPNN